MQGRLGGSILSSYAQVWWEVQEKSDILPMGLPTGGGVGSELDPRIVAWAGSVQHDLVDILLVFSPCTSEF